MSSPLAVANTNDTPGSVRQVKIKTLYTKSPDTSGWLRVRLEPSGESAYLCEYVKVAVSKQDDRTHFVIMEGQHKKKTASLKMENAAKCLIDGKRGGGAKIVAKTIGRQMLISKPRKNEAKNQLVATLTFNGHTAMITLDSDVKYRETNPLSPDVGKVLQSKPLPLGTYKIMTPEIPKSANMTAFYIDAPGGYPELKDHTVWFPIEYAPTHNSNFVHVGNLSEGCVTMYELKMWNPLYAYLISNRSDSEGKYVGTVTIE